MTKKKAPEASAADAVAKTLEREKGKRSDNLKPIEIVKIAVAAFQAYAFEEELRSSQTHPSPAADWRMSWRSEDRLGVLRGTHAAIDRLLFNVNYWRAAYEDRIVAACGTAEEAARLTRAISAWNTHTMKLNNLSINGTQEMFERFCPPFAENHRRGSAASGKAGHGPVPTFEQAAREIAADPASSCDAKALRQIVADVQAEANFYRQLSALDAQSAFRDLLPVWCLQEKIELVVGNWWDDRATMILVIRELRRRFDELDYRKAACDHFFEAAMDALDDYHREAGVSDGSYATMSSEKVLELVSQARQLNPEYETSGYGDTLPTWLSGKERLIWNVIVCAVFGPEAARPRATENSKAAAAANEANSVSQLGIGLDRAVFSGGAIPGIASLRLFPLGSAMRTRQNHKILFDLYAQLDSMHRRGRNCWNLEPANVCVFAYGTEPCDIRAIVVDPQSAQAPKHENETSGGNRYRKLITREIPSALAGKTIQCEATPLQYDMACLELLRYELETGEPVEAETFVRELRDGVVPGGPAWPLATFLAGRGLVARCIDQEVDLDPLARELELTEASSERFPDPFMLAFVLDNVDHGGYLDKFDLGRVARDYPLHSAGGNRTMALKLFDGYLERRLAQGITPEFTVFDDQPETLKIAGIAHVQSIPEKVKSLGYRIVPLAQCAESRRVREFSPGEVEYLAFLEHRRWVEERKLDGWTFGQVKDLEAKTSPFLVPWESLSEDERDLDRDPVRSIPQLLEESGFAISR